MELPVKNEDPKQPPEGAPPTPPPPAPESTEEKLRKLELENAELRGKASVLEKPKEEPKPSFVESKSPREVQWEQTKTTVTGHISSMSDEDFEAAYKMSKDQARAQVAQGDQQLYTEKMNERTARMEAENRLYRKFPDYSDFEDEIREAVNDAAPEIRQDPTRLMKYLERHYKAAKAGRPAPKPKEDPMNRRVIDGGFEKPNPAPDLNRPPAPRTEEMKEDHRAICQNFGIETEEERKQFMGNEIPMNMGGGIVFRNSKKGFEKIKP